MAMFIYGDDIDGITLRSNGNTTLLSLTGFYYHD